MRVYLTEKPSQARDLAAAMGVAAARGHPIRVPAGVITWAIGHLLDLAAPDAYHPEWRHWDLDALPMVPDRWKKRPSPALRGHLQNVRQLLSDASEIVICTDAGREGELIARELIAAARATDTPLLRLWTSALNPAALRNALADLRPGAATRTLYDAALIRERSDWLEGMNLTRLLTLRCRPPGARAVFSAGRVQSPTLAMVVRRQREIDAFVVTDYFTLAAEVSVAGADGTLAMRHEPDPRVTDRTAAAALAARARGATGPLAAATKRHRRAPPAPYELATLQRAAGARRKWPVKKTLDVAQRLYERYKAISYPRTDGAAFDPTEWDTCLAALRRLPAVLPPLATHVPAEPIRRDSVFSAKKLAGKDHHALMPTPEAPPAGQLPPDEAWLLDVISRRFLAQFLPDHVYDQTTVSLDANGVVFTAAARAVIDPGWRAIDEDVKRSRRNPDGTERHDPDDDPAIDPRLVRAGAAATVRSLDVNARRTRPPLPYTEDTLVQAMRKAGVGTKATWPDTIAKLAARHYVTVARTRLHPTPTGTAFVEMLERHHPDLVDPAATAAMEEALESVVDGTATRTGVEQLYRDRVIQAVNTLRTAPLALLPLPDPAAAPSAPRRPKRRTRKS